MKPLVSAIIPVYNCEKYLGEAIESILNQTYSNTEIIVVDDGSEDGTSTVAEKYTDQINLIRQKNSGIGMARNTGIKNAGGEFLAFLDADDIWSPDKLSKQLEIFRMNNNVDIVYGHVKQFLSPEIRDEIKNRYRCPEEKMPGRLASTMLIKKQKFLDVGPFSSNKGVGTDIDWYLRATDKGLNVYLLDEVVMKRRIHTTNTGILHKDKRIDYVRHLKESLDRRRLPKSSH